VECDAVMCWRWCDGRLLRCARRSRQPCARRWETAEVRQALTCPSPPGPLRLAATSGAQFPTQLPTCLRRAIRANFVAHTSIPHCAWHLFVRMLLQVGLALHTKTHRLVPLRPCPKPCFQACAHTAPVPASHSRAGRAGQHLPSPTHAPEARENARPKAEHVEL
jgi:hypothetical protein